MSQKPVADHKETVTVSEMGGRLPAFSTPPLERADRSEHTPMQDPLTAKGILTAFLQLDHASESVASCNNAESVSLGEPLGVARSLGGSAENDSEAGVLGPCLILGLGGAPNWTFQMITAVSGVHSVLPLHGGLYSSLCSERETGVSL